MPAPASFESSASMPWRVDACRKADSAAMLHGGDKRSETEQKARRVGQQKTRAMAGFKGWFQP
jgi:hypothetical protein